MVHLHSSPAVVRWMRTAPQSVHLNTRFPVGGTVWEGVGGVALLTVCHWGGFEASKAHSIPS